jgi:hypothetical protein
MAGPASARAGHLRLSLGRIRPRGIRAEGRPLTQAREVQNHEGSVNQDRRRYSHHGEPRRARQAPRSLVVISGTHEAPVSHPEDEGWSPLGRPAGVLNFTLRLFGKQVEAIPCAQAARLWAMGAGQRVLPAAVSKTMPPGDDSLSHQFWFTDVLQDIVDLEGGTLVPKCLQTQQQRSLRVAILVFRPVVQKVDADLDCSVAPTCKRPLRPQHFRTSAREQQRACRRTHPKRIKLHQKRRPRATRRATGRHPSSAEAFCRESPSTKQTDLTFVDGSRL